MRNLATLTLLLAALPVALPAQEIQTGETERYRSSAAYFGEGFVPGGEISIDSGTVTWKDEFFDQAESIEVGGRWRLGREFWSSLDSNVPFTMGGEKFESGFFYLAMQKNSDGWDLLVIDAAKVRAKQLDASQADDVEGGTLVPLLGATEDVEEDSEKISLVFVAGDSPEKLTLRIDFGPYHLETPVVMQSDQGSKPFVEAAWRRGSRMYRFGDAGVVQAAIDHSLPEWNSSRDEQLGTIKPGMRWRLGSDFWCNLDTHAALDIGGTTVEPGQYYLVLERGEENSWSLVLLDADKVRAKKLDAFQAGTETSGHGIVIAMESKSEAENTEKLTVGFVTDDDVTTLVVAWGPHRMSVPVKIK